MFWSLEVLSYAAQLTGVSTSVEKSDSSCDDKKSGVISCDEPYWDRNPSPSLPLLRTDIGDFAGESGELSIPREVSASREDRPVVLTDGCKPCLRLIAATICLAYSSALIVALEGSSRDVIP